VGLQRRVRHLLESNADRHRFTGCHQRRFAGADPQSLAVFPNGKRGRPSAHARSSLRAPRTSDDRFLLGRPMEDERFEIVGSS
jgi:hypothetical protein